MNDTENRLMSEVEIEVYRRQTVGCRHVNHLNNAGASLMPDVVTKAVTDHIALESEIGGYEASDLRQEVIDQFYAQAARLLNCKPSNIAFTASATDSFTRALSAIPFQKDDVILTDCDDFISNQIQFLSLQKRFGVRLVRIRNSFLGGVDLGDLEEKLNNLKPRLLAITHIPTNSGLVQPVQQIGQIVGRYQKDASTKTWYILDACQSAGQTKLDVVALNCDFLSVTIRKFLRGPRGTGFLFISDRALDAGLEPLFIDMRGADWISMDEYRQQSGARRFEDWEFAYALVIGSMEAIKYCLQVGEDRIWEQIQNLSGRLRSALGELTEISVLDKGIVLGSSVTFSTADLTPDHLLTGLRKQKINVVPSYRNYAVIDFGEKNVQWAIRASPHYYNTVAEIDALVEALKLLI